jgi:hypothetical protein
VLPGCETQDDFTKLMIDNELGFEKLSMKEKRKIKKAAKGYYDLNCNNRGLMK